MMILPPLSETEAASPLVELLNRPVTREPERTEPQKPFRRAPDQKQIAAVWQASWKAQQPKEEPSPWSGIDFSYGRGSVARTPMSFWGPLLDAGLVAQQLNAEPEKACVICGMLNCRL
jgi:hypothetical protein